MSFRDEDQALRERVDALERELGAAQRALVGARRDAADVPKLRARASELALRVEELRAGVDPRRAGKFVAAFVGLGFVTAGLFSFVVVLYSDGYDAALREQALVVERDALNARLADESRRASEAEAVLAGVIAERDRAESAARHAAPAWPDPSVVTSVRTTTIFRAAARVESTTGDAPVRRGADCSVAVTLGSDDECRGEVLCGEESLYPREGHGGYFSCEHDDERHVTRGADVNTSTLSGDPRLDFDRARGTVVVDDGPSPAWSVTVRFRPGDD